MAAAKVPGWNYDADAQRNVLQVIFFAAHGREFLRLRKAQCIAPIVFAKVDQLGDIRVGFRPGLADFEAQPGVEFKTARAKNIRRAVKASDALFGRNALPAVKGGVGRFHRFVGHGHRRLLKYAEDLGGLRRIARLGFFRCDHVFTGNNQGIFAAKHSAHLAQRRFHARAIFRLREVDKRLVREFAAVQSGGWRSHISASQVSFSHDSIRFILLPERNEGQVGDLTRTHATSGGPR